MRPGRDIPIEAWLETLGADLAATVASGPGRTIVPTVARGSTAGGRALAALDELARRVPAGGAELRTGEVLGEGGMGVVRHAEQVALGRGVAVKTLKQGRRDPADRLLLLREAWVTGALEHPNVVPLHTLGLDADGSPVIVMKRIEGVEWSALMRDADAVRARFGATDLLAWNLEILMQVLNAVRFAHSRGVIHRDLKPSNVMIGEFGEVYLLDWGIAVSLHDDGSGRLALASQATEMAGTPCYMAPEMLGDEPPTISPRTDVYLAGALLFEIIAGHPPHLGKTIAAVVASVIESRPALPAGAPPELGRLCLRAMEVDAERRWPSAEAMRLALRDYLEHRGSTRLSDQARERLDRLIAVLAGPAPDHEEVYRLFGASRFGFLEALSAWKGNPEAHAGLVRATEAVAAFELDSDDPRAAIALLSELEVPPPELLARARAAAAARAERQAALERLHGQHDRVIGTRTRISMAIVFGSVFTIAPLCSQLLPQAFALRSHGRLLAWTACFIGFILAFGWLARATLRRTVLNRHMFASILYVFLVQGALVLGAWRLAIPIEATLVLLPFGWAAVSGMVALAIDRRLTASTACYLAAFAYATHDPGAVFYAMSAANFGFMVNAIAVWRLARRAT